MAETDTPAMQDLNPKGFGGWLLLSLVLLIIADLNNLVALYFLAARAASKPGSNEALYAVAQAWGSSMSTYFFVGQSYCLLRFLPKRRDLPNAMTALYAAGIAFLVVHWIGYANGWPWATQMPAVFYPFSFIVFLAVDVAWIGYFQSSVRVKNTFVR